MRFSFLFALAGAALAFSTSAHAQSAFDGNWAFQAETQVGDCAKSVDGAVKIQDGRIVASSLDGVGVWGYVESNGDMAGRFSRGQELAHIQGEMKGDAGSGAWSSNTAYCGGRWKAHRQ